MTFFFDMNFDVKIVRALRALGEDADHLTHHFNIDTDDEDFLPFVGEKRMVLVTRDYDIRRLRAQLQLIKEHGIGVFWLRGKGLPACLILQILAKHWPKMKVLATKNHPPYGFRLKSRGAIEPVDF